MASFKKLEMCLGYLLLLVSAVTLIEARTGLFEFDANRLVEDNSVGLYPHVVNLANHAVITSNATCGLRGMEMYCKQSGSSGSRSDQCGSCDSRSPDPSRRHPISKVTDGTDSWWQSPTLANGAEFHYVTLDIDLRQIYQVAYIVIKSAVSPRPGNWILERSLNGRDYSPWQYFAVSDEECLSVYGIAATPGRPRFTHDSEVICTSYFSNITPMEGGEVHTSLVNGRPGASGPSDALREFTEARYIRLRFQKINSNDEDTRNRYRDPAVGRKLFYSIKDISIGGRCICNGHADVCAIQEGKQKCECRHNACGDQCERCCPLHNQFQWSPGNLTSSNECTLCQCHGQATQCRYDRDVERNGLSLGARGSYQGGGVCINCAQNTEGVNCDRCVAGFYRPQGVSPHTQDACRPCQCSGPGVSGECVRDDTQFNLGILPGACICNTGFEGPRCDRCAPGYRNYPACESCPCNRAGSVNEACEGNCVCKDNVRGPRCDVCAPGMFGLHEHNPVGCTECFCNGATDRCEAAQLPVYTVVEHGNWQVSDLRGRRVIAAAMEGNDARVAHDDMGRFQSYYFVAPHQYLGEKMTSYGQSLSVRASWVKLRGDTSGWAFHGPDVILEGAGFRIAYGLSKYQNEDSARMNIPLHEHGWYHFPKDIKDISVDMNADEYKLQDVTRAEMMQILSSIDKMMIRARYHTVQVESILHGVVLEYGKAGGAVTKLVTAGVERCVCPPGYEGLSCERCSEGFRRINNTIVGGVCEECRCFGNSLTCDPFTGECGECLHFTTGPNCDRCLPGYYGDPTKGEPCLPCLCPLPVGENHFTPTCSNEGITIGSREDFACDCPPGYEGLQCERCADGFFGSPLVPGNFCQPCDCSGNVSPIEKGTCDPVTGQCLKCLGNTAGWRCERCKENHFGDASRGQCNECNCIKPGSLEDSCDPFTGQCTCRPLFVGRQCHRCRDGHGDVDAGCPECRCSPRGSHNPRCDPVTGQCPCKPGVGGKQCNNCLKDYFGDISQGCAECGCNPIGSIGTSCEPHSGQCYCHPNVRGRDCSRCAPGHWGLTSGSGCRACNCDGRGSAGGRCDEATGRCLCTPGVGGERCDRCLPGFWGFAADGCRPCEPCGIAGRSCDPNSGRCICPLNTEGDRCERCRPGTWGYSNTRGCKLCECSDRGSLNSQCDYRTGRCSCRPGFEGPACDRCSQGYYGAPDCRPCQCHSPGTRTDACDTHGRCQCDAQGGCPCKTYTSGRQCNQCSRGTFGMSPDNPHGCTTCYCFGRSNSCRQAELTWAQVTEPRSRGVTVTYSSSSNFSSPAVAVVPWTTALICYINLAMPGQRHLSTDRTKTQRNMNVTNQLHVIPETPQHIVLGTAMPFPAPLYWTLPTSFRKDKIHSYNGYLKFRVHSSGGTRVFPSNILQTYPLVSLQGNWQLVLEHYPTGINPDGTYSVRLHESEWRKKGSNEDVTREMMMIALQNIQHILVRATHSEDVITATLSDVTLDVATEGTLVSSRKAHGVEQCSCPPSYVGLSCQNPSEGYYRWYKKDHIQSTIIIDLVGESKRCDCNGRSETCHKETGICVNCRDNTAGDNCELCASGYYGDPTRGPCRPCACPSLVQNFAETCEADSSAGYICHCKQGYTGDKCDRCAFGFYGRPAEPGGRCVPCNCDPHGSLHQGCDISGQCVCKPAILGRDCSRCAPRHIIVDTGCKSCEDGCVDVLLDDVEALIREVESVNMSTVIPPPWPMLDDIKEDYRILRNQLNHYTSSGGSIKDLLFNMDLELTAKDLLRRTRTLEEMARRNKPPSLDTLVEARSVLDLLATAREKIKDAISLLTSYANGQTQTVSVAAALEEAKDLLKQIENRDNFDTMKSEANIELRKAMTLLEKMIRLQLNRDKLDATAAYHAKMNDNIKEMLDIIRLADTKIERAQIMNRGNGARMDRVGMVVEEVEDTNLHIGDTNFNSNTLLREAQRNLEYIIMNYRHLEESLPKLRNYSSLLADHEGRLYRLNNEYRDRYVNMAREHALVLTAKAIQLEKLINETRIGALNPLNAAQAYQRIYDALKGAEWAARNASVAANKAYEAAYPQNVEDSLLRKAKQSKQSSQELSGKGGALLDQVDLLERELERQQKLLSSAATIMQRTSNKLTNINHDMDTQFDEDLTRNIRMSLARTEATHRSLDYTEASVNAIHANLTTFLRFVSEDTSFDSSLLNSIRQKISESESSTMQGIHLTSTLHTKVDRIEASSIDLSERIKALKQKIKQTRQHASSIRVSVSSDEDRSCVRQYAPKMRSSTTNSLVLSYAINTRQRDALLLYMGTEDGAEFLAVEMKNRRIQVTWDVGGGAQTLVHPLRLLTNTPSVTDDKRWYHIEFNRIGNIGQLQVKPANGETLPLIERLSDPVTSSSPAGHTNIDLPKGSSGVWVGGGPDPALDRLSTTRFAGCLHFVKLDGNNLGLWNFTTSSGCAACNEGFELISQSEDETAFGFNGRGYFRSEAVPSRRPKPYYSVVLAFKTLDEDGLLFLATNDQKNQLFSLTMEGGHVVLRVSFDDSTKMVLKSSKRLNNIADMTQIEATVYVSAIDGKRTGRLAVEDQHQLGTVRGGEDLDLSEEPFYFGGVDPQFDRTRWGSEIVLRSLLGCMGGLSVQDEGRNPFTDGQFYGVENTCAEKPLTEVGFIGGDGYIELPSQELRRDSNFGFSFQTMESNALLMLSTFIGQPLPDGQTSHPPDYYSVSLVEGHLELRLYSGNTQHRVMSRDTFDNGQLHSFFVLKQNRKVTLLVNDEAVNGTRLERGSSVVQGPSRGGLYFGGAPPELYVTPMVGSSSPFKGCIRNVIVNDEVISFTRPVGFKNVYIGRCGDLPIGAMRGMEGDVNEPLACQPPTQHTLEYGAMKFGDQAESYALLPLPSGLFTTTFNVSFEFRTYYPSAVFIYSEDESTSPRDSLPRRRSRIVVTLHKGRLVVTLQNRRKLDPLVITSRIASLNNGEWRKVSLVKERKHIEVQIDDSEVQYAVAPRRVTPATHAYVGGMALERLQPNHSHYPDLQAMYPLRGCLRNLNFNGEKVDVPRLRHSVVGVGQCFARVHPGSYFPGDAYAIYSNSFSVGPLLEFGLEFRTWELNGVLMSVADVASETSLALELVNGAIVLNVTVAEGHSFGARKSYQHRHRLCDNMWHTVRAHFVKDSLTLRVDNEPEAYGFNGAVDEGRTWVEGPLYIGGLPDYASQGSLSNRDNFQGCIRNINMDSTRKDWTDMYRLHNVLLNACPVQ